MPLLLMVTHDNYVKDDDTDCPVTFNNALDCRINGLYLHMHANILCDSVLLLHNSFTFFLDKVP